MKFEHDLWGLEFWHSGEWQAAHEKLSNLRLVCPPKDNIFKALEVSAPETVKVAIIGQDPYPTHGMATGIAFSISKGIRKTHWPPTLQNLLDEYHSDTGFPEPATGDLSPWVSRGVFLWNAIPSCTLGKPLSHYWGDWTPLTEQIVRRLSSVGCVIVLLGGVARQYRVCVSPPSICLEYSHPSPRGSLNSKKPFKGSRMFTTINAKLCELGKQPVDWRLP